jgi:hypothetical protein
MGVIRKIIASTFRTALTYPTYQLLVTSGARKKKQSEVIEMDK